MSLNVADLKRSVAFFQTLFGAEPAKLRSDYAKFEIDDPPLVLSLEPNPPRGSGALNHIGFRVPNSEALVALQHRLESSGISTAREDGVECCYAKQTKFWLHDPDNNLWEIYTLEEDIEHRGYVTDDLLEVAKDAIRKKNVASLPSTKSIWSHRLGQLIPTQLFMLNESVDEINLQGTLNTSHTQAQLNSLLAEIARVLKSDGLLKIHALTSETDIAHQSLSLPGPASVVQQVLSISTIIAALNNAGFVQVEFEKYDAKPCFVVEGAAMRETRLIARKRNANSDISVAASVLYKGAGVGIELSDGTKLRKGVFTQMTPNQLLEIQLIPSDDFVFASQ
jgi:catechol 2,3-dioxygenase-like lactoylglutathione lyase family enzyme